MTTRGNGNHIKVLYSPSVSLLVGGDIYICLVKDIHIWYPGFPGFRAIWRMLWYPFWSKLMPCKGHPYMGV